MHILLIVIKRYVNFAKHFLFRRPSLLSRRKKLRLASVIIRFSLIRNIITLTKCKNFHILIEQENNTGAHKRLNCLTEVEDSFPYVTKFA